MPYTLTAGLLWYAAALGIGIVLGWLLRSTSALRQVSRARRQERSAVQGELDDLRKGTTVSGTVSFTSKQISIAPFNGDVVAINVVPQNGVEQSLGIVSKDGIKVPLVQSTSVDGAIESHPKESN